MKRFGKFFLNFGFFSWAALAGQNLPDADGDGIPDETEKTLGSDPSRPEKFYPVYENSQPRTDIDYGITAVQVAESEKVGTLWRFDFFKEFVSAGVNVLLYLNADKNVDTGRKDKQVVAGVDLQISLSDGVPKLQFTDEHSKTLAKGELKTNFVIV